MSFTNVTASPAALSVSLLGVLDEGQQLVSVSLSVWGGRGGCVVCE